MINFNKTKYCWSFLIIERRMALLTPSEVIVFCARKIMKQLILSLSFLTRIYIPNNYKITDKDFSGSIWLYPFIGLLIGALMSGFLVLYNHFFSNSSVLSFFLILLYVFITGGLHIDGLADSFDGLFSSRPSEKIIEIMSDSRIGAFGAIGLIMYFLGLYICFQFSDFYSLLLFPFVGRSSILLAASITSYKKEVGMGKIIVDSCGPLHFLYAIALSFLLCLIADISLTIPTFIAYSLIIIIVLSIQKKLGGITGDILGLSVELSQLFFLILIQLINSMVIL